MATDPRAPGDTFNPETGALRVDVGRTLTPAEEMAHARRMNEAKAARDAETARTRETAANTVETIGAPSEIEALSDEELDAILSQYDVMSSELQTLEDRDIDTMLKATALPQDVGAPPNVDAPLVPLSTGEAVAGGVRELAGGAMFEFADEVEAAARAPFSDKSYDDLVREIRQNRARFSAEYPGTAFAANVAGGVGSMLLPGAGLLGKTMQGLTGISKLASPLSRTAATGALQGGIAGVGAGENLQERATMGLTGITLGGALGVGAYGAGRGAQFLRDVRVARRDSGAGAEAAAADILAGRVQDPAALQQILASDEALGIPSTLGTTSPELLRLTDVVLRTPSEGGAREALAETIARQQSGAPGRAQQALRTALPTPDYFASMDQVVGALRRNADNLYRAAYAAAPEIRDPRILKALDSPDIQSAYMDAIKNSKREMEAAALRGEDPAQYAMKELFEPVLDAQGALVGLADTGKKVPDLRSLDQIKQALDRRITGLYASGQGGDATALGKIRDAFVNRLDQVGPAEYKAARGKYKGDVEIRDAFELGRQSFSNKTRWQEVAKAVREASDGEKAALTTGFMQNLMQRFEDTVQRRNFAREFINNDNLRNKLRILTPDDEFKVLEATLKREAELYEQTSRVVTGSQTFERSAEARAIEEAVSKGETSLAVDMMLNPTPGNLFRSTAKILGAMRNSNVSRATYAQLAKMLNTSTPQEANAILTLLEKAGSARAKREAAFELGATKAGTAGARVIAPSPETEREEKPFELRIPTLSDDLTTMPEATR